MVRGNVTVLRGGAGRRCERVGLWACVCLCWMCICGTAAADAAVDEEEEEVCVAR